MKQGSLEFTPQGPKKEKPERRIEKIGATFEDLRRFRNDVRQVALDERSVALRSVDFSDLNEVDMKLWEKWKKGKLGLEEVEAHRRILADTTDIKQAILLHGMISSGIVPEGLTDDQKKLYENLISGKITLADIKKQARSREEMKGHVSASLQLLDFLERRIKRDRHP